MPIHPVQRFYRYQAGVYDLTRWAFLYGRRRAIDLLEIRPDSSVLEIGCGTGLNFRHIVNRLDPAQGRVVGVDFSEHMLGRAAGRVASCGYANLTLFRADAERLALDEQFDAVLFAYSLSMIPNWQPALERACEHLGPGGRMAVLDFGRFDRWGPLKKLARGWLRLNHVETGRPFETKLAELLTNLRVESHFGDYYFIAVGQK